jgi:AcrR family transcriptional regulator
MSAPRSRNDPRRAATRMALIEKAELLFAQYGVEGVSTRQIGAAIGSSNTNVVAYHFGSKDALIVEVIRHRVPGLEARRAELLAAARRASANPPLGALIDAMLRPFFEQTDEHGRHTYVAFLSGLSRSGRWDIRTSLDSDYPVTRTLMEMIEAAIPAGARAFAGERIFIGLSMAFAALQAIDQAQRPATEAAAIFADALAMIEIALTAPGPGSKN